MDVDGFLSVTKKKKKNGGISEASQSSIKVERKIFIISQVAPGSSWRLEERRFNRFFFIILKKEELAWLAKTLMDAAKYGWEEKTWRDKQWGVRLVRVVAIRNQQGLFVKIDLSVDKSRPFSIWAPAGEGISGWSDLGLMMLRVVGPQVPTPEITRPSVIEQIRSCPQLPILGESSNAKWVDIVSGKTTFTPEVEVCGAGVDTTHQRGEWICGTIEEFQTEVKISEDMLEDTFFQCWWRKNCAAEGQTYIVVLKPVVRRPMEDGEPSNPSKQDRDEGVSGAGEDGFDGVLMVEDHVSNSGNTVKGALEVDKSTEAEGSSKSSQRQTGEVEIKMPILEPQTDKDTVGSNCNSAETHLEVRCGESLGLEEVNSHCSKDQAMNQSTRPGLEAGGKRINKAYSENQVIGPTHTGPTKSSGESGPGKKTHCAHPCCNARRLRRRATWSREIGYQRKRKLPGPCNRGQTDFVSLPLPYSLTTKLGSLCLCCPNQIHTSQTVADKSKVSDGRKKVGRKISSIGRSGDQEKVELGGISSNSSSFRQGQKFRTVSDLLGKEVDVDEELCSDLGDADPDKRTKGRKKIGRFPCLVQAEAEPVADLTNGIGNDV